MGMMAANSFDLGEYPYLYIKMPEPIPEEISKRVEGDTIRKAQAKRDRKAAKKLN